MPSQSHGRVCFLVALCSITLFLLLLNSSINGRSAACRHGQYSCSGQNDIRNSTLGFEKILVINLPWRTDRRDSITLAAAHTGLSLEWINGINASQINEKAFPSGNHRQMPKGNVGSWRAHMNALRLVVERNLSTALILEDDVDWDERVRGQLADFGIVSRRLPGMIAQFDTGGQAHVPATENPSHADPVLDAIELAKRSTARLPISNEPASSDPYGRDWDIIWLGHCGTSLPPHQVSSPTSLPQVADRFMLSHDPTVPNSSDLRPSHLAPLDSISSIYPPHTRIYHRSYRTLCTLAYAVTQGGARKILYEHGMRNLDKGYDFALSEWCDGQTKNMGERC
ncbi:glycosyltransferase family 25 protein [Cucurbitaria berberidis CBS 394.84]|uniref:Glycosyltransferase family 25 protein n=1 Tax=Cucurbitaria berberidis CBS 394.84 TaxID=1168544 RepID=A0A9P4GH52_9PLEO|nr:glycosyltransferase family 25 protein [Cucurbitaria berberidis CBS 394.84]KAF1845460.1 glycosyltransferase family 25 protein [Cucurbitaria berberidis CBS 394.84]